MKLKNVIFKKNEKNYHHLLKKLNSKLHIDNDEDDDCKHSGDLYQLPPKQCQVCKSKDAKYTCPKCKVNYCDINCYKSHNSECTEEFYKNNVIEELRSEKVTEEESRKFRKNLKEFHEKINDNSPQLEYENDSKRIHLEQILEKLNNGTFDFQKDMTPNDWEEFTHFVSNEKETVEMLYKPFWQRRVKTESGEFFIPVLEIQQADLFKGYDDEESLKRLRELELNEYIECDSSQEDKKFIELGSSFVEVSDELVVKSIILKYQSIPPLEKITKKAPSKTNMNILLSFLGNIAYLFRLYNGDIYSDFSILSEVIETLFHNCKFLYDPQVQPYENVEMCLNDVISKISNNEGKYIHLTVKLIIEDLIAILQEGNKFFVFESLVRFYEILQHFLTATSKNEISEEIRKRITLAKHKMIYYMSYVKSLKSEDIQSLSELVSEYISQREKMFKGKDDEFCLGLNKTHVNIK